MRDALKAARLCSSTPMNDLSSPHSVTRHNTKGLRKSCGPRNFVAAWKSVGRGMFVVALGTLGLVGGCSGGKDRPGLTDSMGGSGSIIDKSCTPREKRQCGFTLHQQGGIKTCYRGVERCNEDGKWGECEDGEVTREPDLSYKEFSAIPPSFNKWQALSDVPAEDCEEACDPKCMHFIEGSPDLGMPPIVADESTPFPGVMGNMCAHGLCETGAPLNAACDPCVNTICNLTAYGRPPDSSCCTTAWDSECVDQVYTKCLNTPPPVKFGLCDFGVYSLQGTTLANRPTAGAAIGSAGSLTLGTDLGGIANNPPCSAGSPTPPGNTSPKMIAVGGDLTIPSQNGASCKKIAITQGVYVKGSVAAQNGGGTEYVSNWHVGGSISMNGGNTITGNVRSGSTPTGVTNGGGTWTAPYPAPVIDIPVALPTRTVTCSGASGVINMTGGQTLSRGPGNYSTVSLSNGNNILSLSPGTYTFQSLSAGGGNSPTRNIIRLVGPASGRWDISVCNNSSVGNWFEIQNNGGTRLTDPKQLILYTNGSFSAGTDSYLAGIIWVPNGTFTSSDRTKVNGAVWARQVSSGTDMNAVQISKADCEGLNIPGTTPGEGGVCPIIATGAGGLPPSEVEPCQSGLNCQMNQRCTDVATSGTCAHSKCLPGTSLVASCDPCVAKVCAAKPACCATAWTQDCIDSVPSMCDASCGGVTGCAHDACLTGSRLVQGCDTGAAGSGNCTQAVCSNAMYAYCCDPNSAQGWNAACVTRAKAVCSGTPSGTGGTNACNFAIAGSAVALGSGAHNNNGTTPIHRVAANQVTTKNLAGVTCGGTGATPVNSNTTWAAASRDNVTVNNGSTLTLSAGTHNINSLALSAWSGSRVTFTGNVVLNICGDLTVGAGTFLTMPTSPSTVTINVKGNVSFGQGAQVTGLSTGADLLRLKLYAAGNFTMGPNATTRGVFMGGGAASSISMSGGNPGEAIHQGVLWTNGSVNLTLDWATWPAVLNTIPVASCLTGTSGLIPAPPVACPFTTPSPVFSGDDDGLCVSNEDGWTQPTCSGFDLALGYVCGSNVPVCNHGKATFPAGNVRVGYYSIEDSPKFAVESPGAASGICTQMLPAIPPGECRDLTCNIPTGKDYTVMVDPSDLLNECSRLDNWSWRDDDFACGGGPASDTFVEYEYKAVCPKDSSALWKNLTWISTVPANSSISFSAKVGECDTEVEDDHRQLPDQLCYPGESDYDDCVDDCLERLRSTGDPYTLLGVSELAPVDTTTCSLTEGGPNCPVALTDQLDLSSNQGQFLLLRVETDFTGGTPSMEDWTVSYTCQYDQ